MSTAQFVHSHVHTDYSALDGAAKIEHLVKEVARLGQPGVAITDHGNMQGAYELWKVATENGVNPIIGQEFYVTPGGTSRFDRKPVFFGASQGQNKAERSDDVSGAGAYTHMTMWAENTEGMHNLFKLSTLAYLEGVYIKPRIDHELLSQYSKGVIGTTGCPSGEIQTRLRLGQWDKAVEYASKMQDILGKDNYFVELMDHGLDIERRVQSDLLKLSKELDIPLIATNDTHYVSASQVEDHDHLLCIQSGSKIHEENRFQFSGDSYYIKSAEEMRELFRDYPEACDNTLLLNERCHIEFDESADLLPRFDVPDGMDDKEYLEKEVVRRIPERVFGWETFTDEKKDEYFKRAQYECGIINLMGFASYFLVVSDFVTWAKDNGIAVGPGRGSAGGCLVSYAMNATELDPIKHGLVFERFLNPDRVSMPDMDIDFDDKRRSEVIQYVTEKYGEDKVSQIITFGMIKAKAALKDATRILDYPYALGDMLSKKYPPDVMGKSMKLAGVFDKDDPRYEEAEEFRQLVSKGTGIFSSSDFKKVIKVALGIEGYLRSTGIHAAGVIMSRAPIADVIPLMNPSTADRTSKKDKKERAAEGNETEAIKEIVTTVTQFDYPTCETLGLLKMDFLGLRNLTVISDAFESIKHNHGKTYTMESLINSDLDDKKTYELLQRGDTLGVFQVEGGGLRNLLRAMRPTTFGDIVAVLALYRPGPMGVNAHTKYADRKNNREEVDYIHPELTEVLKPILDDTYGLCIYQEQIMQIAQKVAGYSLAQADLLRRAMGKKKKSEMDKQHENFSQGMKDRGYSKAAFTELWNTLLPFADYAFNKSHSAGYGLVTYITAWLKAHYPEEYMAALLTSVSNKPDDTALYLAECRKMGIEVIPPSMITSNKKYTPQKGQIVFGLNSVRGLGEGIVDDIVNARGDGNYNDLQSLLEHVPVGSLGKKTFEGLIYGGALDVYGHTRRALEKHLLPELPIVKKRRSDHDEGSFSLFDTYEIALPDIDIPYVPEFSKREKLSKERRMLGLYVSDHPLSNMGDTLQSQAEDSIADIINPESTMEGKETSIAGVVTRIEEKKTKKGDTMLIATVEDMTGEMEVVVFPRTYTTMGPMFADDIYRVHGRIQSQDDRPTNLVASEYEILEVDEETGKVPLWLKMLEGEITEDSVTELQKVMKQHPGETPIRLSLKQKDGKITGMKLNGNYGVTPSAAFSQKLMSLFGYKVFGKWS